MKVPFVDLYAQYTAIKSEMDEAIASVIKETAFIKGKHVTDFEKNFAAAHHIKHCIGVANGTDAIYIVLKMLGIGAGDEVITVANSWISTSETISQTGAKPVFIDIEKDYFTINPDKIKEKITTKTKAIIPVHLYGQMVRIDEIAAICKKHQLFLIEDCAQAHFSTYKNYLAGTTGIAATYSFYPGKNLGAYGDAGAIITNNDALAEKMRMYANHGALVKHQHQIEGINSRLDGLQAAILNVKLKYIHQWNERRLQHALTYNKLLSSINNIQVPLIRPESKHIFHVYAIRAQHRNELQAYLKAHQIETAIHYPTPLPLMPAYQYLGYQPSDIPVAAEYQPYILSLPMFPELTLEQINYVVDTVKNFYASKN